MMIFSLVAMKGLEKCCITSAYLQWLCHPGEQAVALIFFTYEAANVSEVLMSQNTTFYIYIFKFMPQVQKLILNRWNIK